jgi:hypothetical protein
MIEIVMVFGFGFLALAVLFLLYALLGASDD